MTEYRFYLEKFYNTDEQIQTTNPEQEWYIDDSWNNRHFIQDGKSFWLEKKNGRTRIDAKSFKFNGDDGVWEGTPTKSDDPTSFRINVATTNNKAWDKKEQLKYGVNWKDLAKKRGYIIGPEDFRNFEATIYWKRKGDWIDETDENRKCNAQPDQMTIYGRGGLHGADWPEGCLGCCYKGSFDYNKFNKKGKKFGPGSSYFEKEYHHYSGSKGYAERILQENSKFAYSGTRDDLFGVNNTIDIDNRWVGEKLLVYDTNDKIDDGIYAVRSELWVDKNAEESIRDPTQQDWQLMNVFIDRGDKFPPKDDKLADEMVRECNAMSKTQIFAWGGPLISFRIDCTDVQVKYASIREIKKPRTDPPMPN